ncbi:TVP38/TMEM64 family protein [Tolypothrix sp. FACHB-123]|uniref:TVP38/TMEM64 family protein n=1 Tax=Tolypothrix sp. FACHB-123 TaxID=2692868 RepID=UPI001682099A|nr:TVP38/TMEM64 family protein [Tolypothrix sp. FACHB-123]MBD2354400.1 TVP38/TMEM64 family protein [Tolypothrix sp. FACHB-123]
MTNRKFYTTIKLLLLSCLIATVIIASKYLNIQDILHTSIIWVNSLGYFGPIAFIAIYNLATLLFIPGSVLTLKGGCLFGVFWGSVYVIIAAIIGATVAFLIGRYLSRDWVAKQLEKHPKFKAIDLAVAKEGWKIVLLTRLSPIFPFNLLNYAFGVTQVSLKDYILGSIGIIPGTVMYVYLGSLATNLAMLRTPHQPSNPQAQIGEWIIQAMGAIATVAVTIYITKIAQKALKESVATATNNHDANE